MDRNGPQHRRRQAVPELIMVLTDADSAQVRLVPGVERRVDLGAYAWIDGDRPRSEVVDDDVADPAEHLVAEGHRTHPWTFPRERVGSSTGSADARPP